jgi:hypothetical protein
MKAAPQTDAGSADRQCAYTSILQQTGKEENVFLHIF